MSEIVDSLLEKYKALLVSEVSISQELIDALELELNKDTPNAESLAVLIKNPKKLES
jgi:hypothetical protein